MKRPVLQLVIHPTELRFHDSLEVSTSSENLWVMARSETAHSILREPALHELAMRKDPHVLDFCEELLKNKETEDWFIAVRTMAKLGTDAAIDRLIECYNGTRPENKRTIIESLANVLTAENVHPFSIMLRDIIEPGQIDVTGWSRTAISTLMLVCKRFGIETSYIDDSIDSLGKNPLRELSTDLGSKTEDTETKIISHRA